MRPALEWFQLEDSKTVEAQLSTHIYYGDRQTKIQLSSPAA